MDADQALINRPILDETRDAEGDNYEGSGITERVDDPIGAQHRHRDRERGAGDRHHQGCSLLLVHGSNTSTASARADKFAPHSLAGEHRARHAQLVEQSRSDDDRQSTEVSASVVLMFGFFHLRCALRHQGAAGDWEGFEASTQLKRPGCSCGEPPLSGDANFPPRAVQDLRGTNLP